MNKNEKKLLFIHSGSGVTFTRDQSTSCKMFSNEMYLLENTLYYSSGDIAADNVICFVERTFFLQVLTKKEHILYSVDGKEVVRSQFEIHFLSDFWYIVLDENGKKRLFNFENKLVSEDFDDFRYYEKMWYAIKSISSSNSPIWKLYKDDQLVACSENEFLVDVENARYVISDNNGKYSIFAESARPLYKQIDNYTDIGNLFITKIEDVFEIFVIDKNNIKDVSVWKGNQEELLNDVFIFDYIEDFDVVISKLIEI